MYALVDHESIAIHRFESIYVTIFLVAHEAIKTILGNQNTDYYIIFLENIYVKLITIKSLKKNQFDTKTRVDRHYNNINYKSKNKIELLLCETYLHFLLFPHQCNSTMTDGRLGSRTGVLKICLCYYNIINIDVVICFHRPHTMHKTDTRIEILAIHSHYRARG